MMSRMVAPSHAMAAIGLLIASVAFGIVPFFARTISDQGMSPQAVAFYRFFVTALILLPVFLRSLAAWREVTWGLAAGAVMGLGWIGFAAALEGAPVSTVSVLYMTYPVFTVLISWLVFGDPASRRAWVASGLIVLAAVIAGNPAIVPADQMPLLLLSLGAPLGFGFGICVLVHRLSVLPPLSRIAAVSLGSVLALTPIVASSPAAEVIPQDVDTWIMLAGLAVGSAFVPQLIYTICSPVIGASRTAIFGSVELPTMIAVGIFAFGEVLSLPQAIACGLILAAVLLTQSRSTRNVSTTLTKR